MSDTSASHVGATLFRPVASSGNRFIDQTCRTFFCHGREKLLGVVEILERDKFAGFLAVAGNDSSEIFGDRIASANVIITDENDLEFSIFQSDVFRDFWRVLNFRPTAIFAQIKAWEAATRDSAFSYRRRFGD
jgi:hypothetical protein